MYCVKCGKKLEGDDQYCKDCSPKNASSDDLVFGIIALVMGIMSFLGGGIITSIVAIWLGDKSINTKGEVYGKPGKTLGIVSLVISVISIVIAIITSITIPFLFALPFAIIEFLTSFILMFV